MNYMIMPGLKRPNVESMDAIIKAVGEACRYTEWQLTSKRQHRNIVAIRYVCMYLIRQNTDLRDTVIAERFGKERTSVKNAIKVCQAGIETNDPVYLRIVDRLRRAGIIVRSLP
jgi:chromosomal replication initiation ATPase DnaA